ncbi:hypothetical protein BDV93DRAFT_605683 [Ceratobasidium sp. AG-I]|nr:hypothetical protein BDV93DRAFT_605683 [Ceratobasidium sp. AG-I]
MPIESMPSPQTNNKWDFVDLGAGDIELCVNNTIFKTHKYKLNKFSILKDLIQRIGPSDRPRYAPTISVQRGTGGVEDFNNMFKVLYASVVKGPFTFDPPILISALRISTAYDYPALRAFSIVLLEGTSLSAIQRIELGREFQLPTWEGPAYDELYTREEPISQEEAQLLGSKSLSVVARVREENLKREKFALREAIAQARREADEQGSQVVREREREQQAEATRDALQRALGEAEKTNRETVNRVMQEANEQANRMSLDRDRREAEAMIEAQKALAAALEKTEKAKNKAINQVKRKAQKQTNKWVDWVVSERGTDALKQQESQTAWKRRAKKRWAELMKEVQ